MGKAPAPDPWKDTKSLPRQAGRPHTRRGRLKRIQPPPREREVPPRVSGLSFALTQPSPTHRAIVPTPRRAACSCGGSEIVQPPHAGAISGPDTKSKVETVSWGPRTSGERLVFGRSNCGVAQTEWNAIPLDPELVAKGSPQGTVGQAPLPTPAMALGHQSGASGGHFCAFGGDVVDGVDR